SWQQVATPNVPGVSGWGFTSVSCTSPRICMAVGETFGSTNHLLSESRTKKGWTIRHIPQPSKGSALQSVWCTSRFACTAVGYTPGSHSSALAERWNGSSWRIQRTPKPKGADISGFDSVTCASAHDCVAVGSGVTSTTRVALVEHWNGPRW